MLSKDKTVLVCIDIQEQLAKAMYDREQFVAMAHKLIAGMAILNVPVLWTEQNPARLGATLSQIASAMPHGSRPVSKMSFSCCGCDEFMAQLKALNRPDVLLAGIETHVCVLQTAMDLLGHGCRVQAVSECLCSRTPGNHAVGLERMRSLGVQITSVEAALFELLRTAAAAEFREISKLIK